MEQYERVAVLLGMECLVQHRHGLTEEHDKDWKENNRKNYCHRSGCYVRLCEHCAGVITYRHPDGPWTMYCQEHATR